MASLTKVTYVDGKTVIHAENLNDIQDAILDLIAEGLTFADDGQGNITVSTTGGSTNGN